MNLSAENVLVENFKPEEVEELRQLQHPERMPKLTRQRISRTYVHKCIAAYANRFHSQHVVADVIMHVANHLSSEFPCLADRGSTPQNKTFVSWYRC